MRELSMSIQWPAVMATTVGSPTQCSYSDNKKVVWRLAVPSNHRGKNLGGYGAESEATFPMGTTVEIESVLIRRTSRTEQASEFGKNAEVIIFGKITSVAPEPFSDGDGGRDGRTAGPPPPPPPGSTGIMATPS